MRDEPHQRPAINDRDAWRAYWQTQGMPWRTEPEIDEERQQMGLLTNRSRPWQTTASYTSPSTRYQTSMAMSWVS